MADAATGRGRPGGRTPPGADRDRFDLIVLGAGPAGEKGAAQAAYFDKRVAIVEASGAPGGIAVESAGIPTKTLRESAIHLSGLGQRPFGPDEDAPILEPLMARKTALKARMTLAARRNLTRHGVEFITGRGRLLAGGSVDVTSPAGERRVLRASAVLIATGGQTVRPAWMPAADPLVRDSDDILGISRLPKSLLVVGGGAVGCEYASIFACLGVNVTLVCRADRVLTAMDAEASRVLAESFNGLGIRVLPRAELARLIGQGDRVRAVFTSCAHVSAEMVLVAVGRRAATQGLGLEEAGVATRPDGSIQVDEHYETSLRGVFAAGDVIGSPELAAAAMEEARVAVCHAFGFTYKRAVDEILPQYVFSIPEIASVGITEEAARRAAVPYEVGRAAFGNNAKAQLSGFADGFVKLVFRTADRVLLGVHIVGEQASELIHLGQLVLQQGGTIERFIHTTFAVPTRSEAYKYAAYDGLMRLSRRNERSRRAVRERESRGARGGASSPAMRDLLARAGFHDARSRGHLAVRDGRRIRGRA